MNRLVAAGVLIVSIAVAGYALWPEEKPASPVPVSPARVVDPPTSVTTDTTAIFQRAFWRHPSPGDKVLHAERREWADENGVDKWQWFIVVEASPELARFVKEENLFGLVSAGKPLPVERAPKWFTPPADGDVLHSREGNLQYIFAGAGSRIYATDSGKGFHAATPEKPPEPPRAQPPAGRLPAGPPPNPDRQR